MKIKKIFFLILSIGIFSCKDNEQFKVDCLPTNLQNGVIAFYPFNGGSLDDKSTNSNNLANPTTAIPSTDRGGNADCAFYINNSKTEEEYLTATNSIFLNGLNEF